MELSISKKDGLTLLGIVIGFCLLCFAGGGYFAKTLIKCEVCKTCGPCPVLPTCSREGITHYCGESCSDICNLDCPLPSSYCGEIDDICPEEVKNICELMSGEFRQDEKLICKMPDCRQDPRGNLNSEIVGGIVSCNDEFKRFRYCNGTTEEGRIY